MSALPLDSVPFSELLRHPAETAERLSRTRAVRLRRRDAGDLVLMSAERAESESVVVHLTARLLARVAQVDPQVLREALPATLPWMRFLPQPDADAMTEEFIAAAEAATALGNTAAVSQVLTEWQHTAEVYADPEIRQALTRQDRGDFGPVPRPSDG